MTPTQLTTLAKAIYGEGWKSPMARDRGVAYLTVLRWAQGKRGMPDDLEDWLKMIAGRRAELAAKRGKKLERLAQ